MTKMTKSYIQRTEDMCYKCSHLRHTRSREGVDSENTDAHDCHETIQKRNAQNSGKLDDGKFAEKGNDVGDLIYSFGPMHLLHVDIGKIKKRSLSRESANGESKLNLEHFVLIFSYK